MALSGRGRREKGASFERFIAERMRRVFPDARRNLSQTRTALREGGDVLGVKAGDRSAHVECKHGIATIQSAMRQAKRDAAEDAVPLVVSQRDRGDTLVTLTLDDWMDLASYVRRLELALSAAQLGAIAAAKGAA